MGEALWMQEFTSRLPSGPLLKLLAIWLLVGTGGWAFTVAIAVYAFHKAGAGGVGAVTAARLLPAVLVAPFTGDLIDRGDRARVVAIAAVLQAVCVGAAAALVFADVSLVSVVVLAGASGAAATAPRPALEALMPALADSPDALTRATAVWSATDSAGFLLGGGAGGIAIAATGAATVIAGSALLLSIAGLLAFMLPAVRATAADEGADDEEGFAGALAGLRAVVDSPMLHAPFALFAGLLVLEGTTDVQLVALALGKLHLGNGGPGLLFIMWGAGGLFGSYLILVLVRRRGYGLALSVGGLCFGVGLAVAGLDGVTVALAAMVAAGIGFSLVETSVTGLVPRLADDRIVGRVYALFELLYAGACGTGALIAPVLINGLGVPGSLAAVGVAFTACALLASRSYARLDAGQEQARTVRELLRGIRFLAPLPLPRLERLVRGARAVFVPAGAAVVRIGEHGEEFFVIEHGSADVLEVGQQLGAGEAFGEIALLQDVPRTATVRAASDLRLWAITRQAFLAAVTGHGDASRLADAVVAEHFARLALAEVRRSVQRERVVRQRDEVE
jgi:MFS family permease